MHLIIESVIHFDSEFFIYATICFDKYIFFILV